MMRNVFDRWIAVVKRKSNKARHATDYSGDFQKEAYKQTHKKHRDLRRDMDYELYLYTKCNYISHTHDAEEDSESNDDDVDPCNVTESLCNIPSSVRATQLLKNTDHN